MNSLSRVVLAIAFVAASVSCGKTAPTQPGVNATPTPVATPPPSGARTVSVGSGGGMVFIDSVSGTNVTTISMGQTVMWVWASGTHSTTSGSCCTASGTWDSGIMNGGSFSHTFSSPGTFPYFCRVHGSLGMTGTVVVN